MGDAKYDFSSLCAIARMLLMHGLSFGDRRHRRRCFFRREREEDLLEAHAHRPQLEQSPSVADHRPRQVAAHVAPVLALDLVPDEAVAAVGLGHARDARDVLEGAWRGARW